MEKLTTSEQLILDMLMTHVGERVPKYRLRASAGGITEGSLRVMICSIRQRLPPGWRIRTIWHGGYVMERVSDGKAD